MEILTPHEGTENVYLRAFDSSSVETNPVGKELLAM
jgi:hypothetical protein